MSILNTIRRLGWEKDYEVKHAADRLRGAIERFKRQFDYRPWCEFRQPKPLRRDVEDNLAREL